MSLILCNVSPNAFCNVILSIKQIGSEKLDFSLFGQNIYYAESFAHGCHSKTNIANIIFSHADKVLRNSNFCEKYFSISLSYSLGLFPPRVNHPPLAPGGRWGTPLCFYLMRFPFPIKNLLGGRRRKKHAAGAPRKKVH